MVKVTKWWQLTPSGNRSDVGPYLDIARAFQISLLICSYKHPFVVHNCPNPRKARALWSALRLPKEALRFWDKIFDAFGDSNVHIVSKHEHG
jgi:hypothetical protein